LKNESDYLESVLIGTVLHSPGIYPEVAALVKARDFVTQGGREAWIKIGEYFSHDNSDLMAKVYIGLQGDSRQWVSAVSSGVIPTPSAAKRTARMIADLSKKKRLAVMLRDLAAKAATADYSADGILEGVVSAYNAESGEVDADVRIISAMERFKGAQAKNAAKGGVGLRTGFDLFQSDYIVYQPGHLWVVGAWTSAGKTAYMVEAVNRFFVENPNGKQAIFSTEMTEEQNIARSLANLSGINANVILSGQMIDGHNERVNENAQWLAAKHLFIHSKLRNIDDIMAQCRKLKYAGGIDLIWIDFIQNVTRPGTRNQYDMMSQIAKDLQNLAHDLQCTIVCLSQLPNHAGREDSGILEFKGAGEIAAACDVGVLMKRSKDDEKVILFDIRKNRHGKCGKYLMQFENGYTRITEREAVK
jgi:replicative DNA helicase